MIVHKAEVLVLEFRGATWLNVAQFLELVRKADSETITRKSLEDTLVKILADSGKDKR